MTTPHAVKASLTAPLRRVRAQVGLVDLPRSRGEEVATELNAKFGEGRAAFIAADVTKDSQLRDAFAATKRVFNGSPIEIVFNNAGVATPAFERMDLAVALNLTAVMRGTELALQEFKAEGTGGVVVNVASIAGIVPLPTAPVYAATKAGVVNFTRSMKFVCPPRTRVSALCPAFTATPMVTDSLHLPGFKQVVDAMGRVMSPEEVADAAMRLIEEEHGGDVMYITPHTGPKIKVTEGQAKL